MKKNELVHHGIKGMKWGVRRTEAQLARARGNTKSDEKTSSTSAKKAEPTKRKKMSEMSDEELRRVVNRLQLEQQYRNLNPEKVSAGKKFANKVVKDIVIPVATEVAKNEFRKVLTASLDGQAKKKRG